MESGARTGEAHPSALLRCASADALWTRDSGGLGENRRCDWEGGVVRSSGVKLDLEVDADALQSACHKIS